MQRPRTARARYQLELARCLDLYTFTDYNRAFASAKDALRMGDKAMAILFAQEARIFLEGDIRKSVERFERFEKLVIGVTD